MIGILFKEATVEAVSKSQLLSKYLLTNHD